jgi:uncharacterized phage-associated protein
VATYRPLVPEHQSSPICQTEEERQLHVLTKLLIAVQVRHLDVQLVSRRYTSQFMRRMSLSHDPWLALDDQLAPSSQSALEG